MPVVELRKKQNKVHMPVVHGTKNKSTVKFKCPNGTRENTEKI